MGTALGKVKTEMQKQLDESEAKTRLYYDQVFDSEFYAVVCFQTSEQRNTWLKARGQTIENDYYVNGLELAAADGVALPPSLPWKEKKVKQRWADLALPPSKKGPSTPTPSED
jgi:hypothetical protein